MDIVNFFEKVEGTWFSQRTTHFGPGKPSQTGQTTLQMTRLLATDDRITALCNRFSANVEDAISLAIEQNGSGGTYTAAPSTPAQTTLLVALKSETGDSGIFFSQTEQEAAVVGRYTLKDEVLTLKVQTDDIQSEERIWFMNPNLRMRTSVLRRKDGFEMASFCSEIRRLSS